jgi:nitrogen fixation protein
MEEPESMTVSKAKHLAGGSLLGSLKNGMKWVASHISPVKNFLQQHVDHPIANKAVEIASKLGLWNDRGGQNINLHDRLH